MPITRLVFACVLHAFVACASRDGDVPSGTTAPYGVDLAPELRGAPDRGRDPAIVALVGADNVEPCTGALVAPDIVLTARSCLGTAARGGADPCTGSLAPPSSFDVWTGEDLEHASLVGHGRDVVIPKDPNVSGCDVDVALVLLDRDVPGIHTLSFRAHGPSPGEHVRAAGHVADTGKMLRDHVTVLDVMETTFTMAEAPCLGRGHVVVDEDTGEVLGVGAASTACASTDPAAYVRTDAFFATIAAALARSGEGEALRKLQAKDAGADASVTARKLSKSERPTKDLGASCASGTECAAGVCARVRAGRYCARRCSVTDRCPTGWRCTSVADESSGAARASPDGGRAVAMACVRSSD
jgi:hypothetical protein